MAAVLLKTSIRSVISTCMLSGTVTPLISAAVISQRNIPSFQRNFQSHVITRQLSNKVKSHRTGGLRTTDDDSSDSGSDSDDARERADSPFWRRKMRTLHSHLDVNKDGVISYEDFMLLGDRFSKIGHLTPEAKAEFKRVLNDLWEEQWGEISQYNLVCIEKYLEGMHHVLNDKSLKKKCHRFLPYLFKAIDKDQSGEISVQEFKLFFECLGLTNDNAVISFSHIDTDDDGKISFEEFVVLGRDFFITEDPKRPSKYFWGPLVD